MRVNINSFAINLFNNIVFDIDRIQTDFINKNTLL